jgi:CheY-like chemotaxis protein
MASPSRKKRILFVEDKTVFRDPIAKCLEQNGYKMICASNGKEALAAIDSQVRPYDIMLIDVSMPQMDGITLLTHLRNNPKSAQTPVIMLTAAAEKNFVLQAHKLGVSEYLIKSNFSLEELLECIKKYT